jgi:hypothetical protein
MHINFSYLKERSTSGGYITFIVFHANSVSGGDSGRAEVLHDLTMRARANGYVADQAALTYRENGRTAFYGSRNLVDYLSRRGAPRPTHYIDT